METHKKEVQEKVPDLAECLEAADQTKYMLVEDGALKKIPEVLRCWFSEGGDCTVFLAADENTIGAAGAAVLETLKAEGIAVDNFIFSGRIHANYEHVQTLKKQFNTARKNSGGKLVPLAAGSGTINDLVKRAASELGLSYLCVPTAASVDGYTAYGAALLYEGFKQTCPCQAPLAVAADTAVLAAAPAYLGSSGFGDLAGKIIAGTDWIIADRLYALDGRGELAPGSEKIEERAWAMVQLPLKNNLAQSVNAAKGDRDAVKTLFEALGITGFALQYMKNSRAVSGCEHMWSHVWEMENLSVNGIPVTHGHKVAVGTLAAAAFTECLFAEKPSLPETRPAWSEREADVREAFAGMDRAAEAALASSREKFIDDDTRARRLAEGILDNWDGIRRAVFEKLPSYNELLELFKKAGAPVQPTETGLSRERIIAAARKAQMIRNRFTVLDLAYETGALGRTMKRMEASGLYFA
jgi:glycerol-1-phosphate dehydrogenase [NAD(P)+]